jgi:hypothetical protein
MDSNVFEHLMLTCTEIIAVNDDSISSQACSVINSVFSWILENSKSFFGIDPSKEQRKLLQLIMRRVFLEELETQWSFSRPFLPLILFDTNWFLMYLNHLESIQPTPEKFDKVFVGLLDGIGSDLSVKNRDLFTRNVDATRRAIQTENLCLTIVEI